MAKPQHPLVSLINVDEVKQLNRDEPTSLVFDFNERVMSFIARGQVVRLAPVDKRGAINQSGWVLNIHPDFPWNTPLAKTIKQYDFWSYSLREALFLSACDNRLKRLKH